MFKLNLLYPAEKDVQEHRYYMSSDLIRDLDLSVIFSEMADKDEFIYNTCMNVLLKPICDEEVLQFRQEMVKDAIYNNNFYNDMYQLAARAIEAIQEKRRELVKESNDLSKIQQIYSTLEILTIETEYMNQFKKYFWTPDKQRARGLREFMVRIKEFYNENFAMALTEEMKKMRDMLQGGRIMMTGTIGEGMKCADVVVNQLEPVDYRHISKLKQVMHSFLADTIRLTDPTLVQQAKQMETNALYYVLQFFQKVSNIFRDIFEQLKTQMGFYVGCYNLYRKMTNMHMNFCFPKVRYQKGIHFCELREMGLALTMRKKPVSNSFSDGCHLHIISGANQGGKSTFLRSIGIAQIMMQAGLFVSADCYESALYDSISTHFLRREDCSMNSGRLREEMKRMNQIVDLVSENSMILMNESFASTTEKEGSAIAEGIIQAFYDCGVTVWMVTHLFAFANRMFQKGLPSARFLSAERTEDGVRTFRMLEHEPVETSYGLDLYEEIVNGCDD